MTNIEYIKSLSPTELSKFLYSVYLSCCVCCNHKGKCTPDKSCREEILKWLQYERGMTPTKWDDVTIDQLELTSNAYTGLYQAGIYTVGELRRYRLYDLAQIPHLGEKNVKEIAEKTLKLTGQNLRL